VKFDIVDELPDSRGRQSGWSPMPKAEYDQLLKDSPLDLEPHLMMQPVVDLRPLMPAVYIQGLLNSCTSNAAAALLEYLRAKQHMPFIEPSRMYLYWYQRVAVNKQDQNAGCSMKSAFDVATNRGYCPEPFFPYNGAANGYQFPAPPAADLQAPHHRGAQCVSVPLAQLHNALANGFPVAFGFYYFNSFFQADGNGGQVPMPQANEVGARPHAALIVGYNDLTQAYIVRNSWGLALPGNIPCGDQGHYYMPYAYINNPNLCSEFFTVTSVVDVP
jgi:hypothetical protein